MTLVAIIASILFLLLWMGGGIHVLPINLHSSDNRHFIKKQGRLYRGHYSLWHPVTEVIPYVLYVSTKQPFYLDDYGFERGR